MCFCCTPKAFAAESNFNVEQTATILINNALTHPDEFYLPDLTNKAIYICRPIHPHVIEGNGFMQCNDIEYYMIRTENDIIACVTLCYEDGEVVSASLDIGLANIINGHCELEDAFRIVVQSGTVYLKTADGVVNGMASAQVMPRDAEQNVTIASINNIEGELDTLIVQSELLGIIANPIVARSSRILSVPYVSQEGLPICWAAAAAAMGRYYTGSAYVNYSASTLAAMVGVGNQGGTILDSMKILSDIFHVNTTFYNGRLSNNTTINLFQQGKPILAVFHGYYDAIPEQEVGHMVVLCGYDDNNTGSNTILYIRDSNYTTLTSVISFSDNELRMDYYTGITMYWVQGAY